METSCPNVCRAIHCGSCGGLFHSQQKKKGNLYEYVLTSHPVQVDFAD